LAELRVEAMKPSLKAVGRFDPARARSRFPESYSPADTYKIMSECLLVGFFFLRRRPDHIWLDHLYILPEQQGQGVGRAVLNRIKKVAMCEGLPIRLCALRDSEANQFYLSNGFVFQYEEEWDLFYQFDEC